MLGPGLKGGNPDIKENFKIVDCRTLTVEGKVNCRLLSLKCSTEFLAYVATKTKNHWYKLYNIRVFINGGQCLDSTTEYNALQLSPDIIEKVLKSNRSNQIMMYHANWIELGLSLIHI